MIAGLGEPALQQRTTIAQVGARDGSAPGPKLAQTFAAELSQAGYVVVPGLARGVDRAAHTAALSGGAAAVLAGGPDRPYLVSIRRKILPCLTPSANAALWWRRRGWACRRAGCVPQRNHLISGLSQGVVVIETALRSGSLITADALEALGPFQSIARSPRPGPAPLDARPPVARINPGCAPC
jgi:DNA processing protein